MEQYCMCGFFCVHCLMVMMVMAGEPCSGVNNIMVSDFKGRQVMMLLYG